MNIDVIKKTVLKELGISEREMQNNTRKHESVYARQIYAYFLNKKTKLTLTTIGKLIGGPYPKHHATVIHSLRTLNDLIYTDEEVQKEIQKIENTLNNILAAWVTAKKDNDLFIKKNPEFEDYLNFQDCYAGTNDIYK